MSPKYISQADVDQDYLKSEEDIIREQIANDPAEASKPDKVKEGMIKGRMSKLMKDVCLLDQVYVKAEDGKQSVSKYLQSVGDITVAKFVRFETGEGLEKKEENFAEEVAKQMGA
jgi:elongation factor Ts